MKQNCYKLFVLIITLAVALGAKAQQGTNAQLYVPDGDKTVDAGINDKQAAKPMLSGFTQQYLLACKKQSNDKRVPNYVYKTINSKIYISALIKVSDDMDQSQLTALGVFIGTKAGKIWTAQIPVENVAALTTVAGISYIQLDRPVYPALDSARKQTRADSAQSGINLPSPVTGKNVLTGIIDAGFDFTHPTFYDTTHSAYRIRKVWTQKVAGTPPSGFAYGSELADSDAIRSRGYDTLILSHGTHVAGIAAGSGYGSSANNNKFRGIAFESDIALVAIMPATAEWVASGESDIIDGMSYLYNYAASVGEPAVINLSWASDLGPHDGTSLFSQACDALTGPGKIFVVAAGNSGQDTLHLQKTFTTTDTTVSTFITFSPYTDTINQQMWVDVWGDTGNAFCVNIKLYDSTSAIDSTGYVCVSANTTVTFNLIGSNGDTCVVTITVTPADYNGKPHALIALYNDVYDNICLTTKATAGIVNMWEGYVVPPGGYTGQLVGLGYPWAVSGDVSMTISDLGCTKSAITVGAYASKIGFTNISHSYYYYLSGTHGHIAPSSSFGPTGDYRIKPDITAPGLGLASSVSSYDSTYNTTGNNYITVISADTDAVSGRIHSYAMLSGTSMASPCVAGIVAMMLQINPTLSPDEAKSIINYTAITDVFTGILPVTGTNTWGHGKINAYGAVSYLVTQESVKNLNISPMDCILYPNPNHGSFTIKYLSKTCEQLKIEIFDMAGKNVSTQNWYVSNGYNTRKFNVPGLSKGNYSTKITSPSGYNVIKMTVY